MKNPVRLLLPLLMVLAPRVVTPQDMFPFDRFNEERVRISAHSMLVLGGWATGNMIAGGIGMATTPSGSEAHHFHQMNLLWNVVNLGIAVPAYVGARRSLRRGTALDIPATFGTQRRVEALYLINAGLDLAYMGAGLWLWENGRSRSHANSERFQGFGTSLLLQGGFLFVYDLACYAVHTRHWKGARRGLWQQLRFNGTSLELHF